MTHHPIVVIGAGLGGLTFAAVLHRHGIDVVCYELDASPTARDQGGMLDMHEDSGQAALRAAGLFEWFQELVLPGGEAMRILDKAATVRWSDDGDDGNRPEVNRQALRDLLLSSLPGGTVRWGAKATAVNALADGRHEVTFADGGIVTTDLLIGADGAWSKVRPLLSPAGPAYSGLSFVELSLLDSDHRHPAAAALVGAGSLFALGERQGFLGHRDADGRLHVYAALQVPADWADGIDFTDTPAAKAAVLAHFTGWDEGLRSLVADADGPLVPRAIHALPVGLRWPRTAGVSLIGDAAHLMSPFAGEGANLAMLDGAELAAGVAAHPDAIEEAIAGYEETMFPRSAAAAAESAANLAISFGPDAPQGLLDRMAEYRRIPSDMDSVD
jgi:2-polyprenyl-6-methoxyphenol hydroxylase-like FAD-dependent oxidoreductase